MQRPDLPTARTGALGLATVAILLMMTAWTLATPLGASPDEPAQVVSAAADVRGQLASPLIPGPYGRVSSVTVPAYVAGVGALPGCFAGRANIPDSCAPTLNSSTAPTRADTQFSRYPPLFYVVTGLATLVAHGRGAIFGIRFISVFLEALFLSLGILALSRHRNRNVLLGVCLALSPLVLFVGSTSNPSGLETSTAFAVWCSGLVIATGDRPPRSVLVILAVGIGFLMVTRPFSPGLAIIIVVSLALLTGRAPLIRLWRAGRLRLPVAVGLIATAAAGGWDLYAGAPQLLGMRAARQLSLAGEVRESLSFTGQRLQFTVGNMGWFDTPAPRAIWGAWALGVALLVLLCLLARKWRATGIAALIVMVTISMPLVLEAPRLNMLGPFWAPRYDLPIIVGLPLVAASGITLRRKSMETTVWLAVGLIFIACQVAMFSHTLTRYQTGLGPGTPGLPLWHPPVPASLLVAMLAAGAAALPCALAMLAPTPGRSLAEGDAVPG